jgi:hypothetical protein
MQQWENYQFHIASFTTPYAMRLLFLKLWFSMADEVATKTSYVVLLVNVMRHLVQVQREKINILLGYRAICDTVLDDQSSSFFFFCRVD